MAESTFWSDIDKLTTATHKIIHRDHGTEVLTSTGLIQQLREAVEAGREGGAGSASFGSRPPIDATAKDLLREIGGQARAALWDATGNMPPVGRAETHIRLWAAAVNESTLVSISTRQQVSDRVVDDWYRRGVQDQHRAVYRRLDQMSARRLVQHWISRIEGFFYPPDMFEIPANCPSCDARHVHRDKDGQTVQTSALKFVREDGDVVEARCLACGLTWLPAQFEWLAKAVGARPLPELVDDTPVRITGL